MILGYSVQSMNVEEMQLQALASDLVQEHRLLMTNLIDMRKQHDLTQEAVAERMGVSQPTVAAFERYDSNPTLSTIRRYALAVGAAVRHHVTDECCDFDEQLATVIRGGAAHWLPAQATLTWGGRARSRAQYVDF